jgi:nucleotide-binding universal stress UspA family protein
MIRNILVSVGDKPYEKNALDYAGHLAVLLGAHHLSCIFFQDRGRTSSSLAEEVADRILKQVETEYSQYDFLNYHVEVATGDPEEMICQEARSADLVVIGIPESIKTDGLRLLYDRIDDVLLNITKPTIVVHEQCTLLRKILIVDRGDRSSDRVLESAVELAERAKASILGLAIAETQTKASEIAQQMREYVRYRGIEANFITRLGFTVTNILETANENDCDLIALSASHHGRLYQIIFQSTTEMVVKLASRAVMVAQ